MNHAKLIEELGNGTVVATELWGEEATTKQRDSVYKWKSNGVPWRYRPAVAALAKKKRVELPPDFLAPAHASAPSNARRTDLPRTVRV